MTLVADLAKDSPNKASKQLTPDEGNVTAETTSKTETVAYLQEQHSSGAVWESRWTSWAVRPKEPSGFRGRKELLNRASALVTTCP